MSHECERLVRGHLPLLKDMFPGVAWLNVPQVAACLKLSAGHIYNQHSSGSLPFKMNKNQAGRLRASVQDIAAYMDSQQLLAHSGKRLARGPRLRWMASPQVMPKSEITHETAQP